MLSALLGQLGGGTQPFLLNLTSTTDVNLQTFLSSNSAPTNRPIEITIPSGNTIGATSVSTAAIVSGNLSSYLSVALINEGEIQGAGGAASSGNAGNAITATTSFALWNKSGAAIRGGGGGGGNGGSSGYGENLNAYDDRFASSGAIYLYRYNACASSDSCEWNSTNVGSGTSAYSYFRNGSYIYWPGAFEFGAFYHIRRATRNSGTRSGGAGGVGRGYGQAPAAGSAGASGTGNIASGGTGGTGGEWGTAGSTGNTGGNSSYWKDISSTCYSAYAGNFSNVGSGSAGVAGGSAGLAISAPGVTIYYQNDGTINGSTNFTSAPYPS